MICLIIALLSCGNARLEFQSFNPKVHITSMHQVNESWVVIGTSKGELGFYSPKGQLMGELRSRHKAEVVGIESGVQDGRGVVISADQEGTVLVWNEDNTLVASLSLQRKILQIAYSKPLLAINLGQDIQFYDIATFTSMHSLHGQEGTFRKVHFSDMKLYYLLQGKQGSRICSYNRDDDMQKTIIEKGQKIVDFAVYQSSQTTIIYLINSHHHLEIIKFPTDHSPNIQLNFQQQQSQILQSNYSSVTLFHNNASLPIFTAIKSPFQLQFFTDTSISMFLQFNYDIRLAKSTSNNSLLLATQTDQLTLVKMYDHDEQQYVWLIVFSVILLAVALYLCCGDCCPGIYEKYVAEKERKEIELQLYKKRTELDNF